MFTLKSLFPIAVAALFLVSHSSVIAQTPTERGITFTVHNVTAPVAPRVRFAVIGDRTGSHVEGVYERAVAEVARLQPDFVLTVGDQIEGYTEDSATLVSQWQEYFSIIAPLTVPVYLTPGNHDITTDGMLPMYKRYVGEPYRSFDVGNLHFVILDNSRWESSAQLPSDQIAWLAADLTAAKSAKFTFVFFHKPFWYNSLANNLPDTLHALFVKGGVDAVFNGHFHRYFSGIYDGIKYTAVGSSGGDYGNDLTGMGYHFMWVTVDSAIEITPIKLGAVLPWDEFTIDDAQAAGDIEQNAVAFESSAPVSETAPVETTTVRVTVTNFAKEIAIADSIRWSAPDGWSVLPAVAPLAVAPAGKSTVEFRAIRSGNIFPVPTLSATLPFKEGRSIPVRQDMQVARQAKCARVSKAPTIDGRLDETCWRNPINRLYNGDGTIIDSTFYYFAFDKSNLYVAVHCRESRPDSLGAAIAVRDGAVYGEDCVGFFFRPDRREDTVYQVYFNPLGTVFDQRITPNPDGYFAGDRRWNGTYEVKTTRTADGWDVEARILLKQLGISAKSGDQWNLNFRRKQKRLNSGAEWQTPIDYNPKTFGVLRFE